MIRDNGKKFSVLTADLLSRSLTDYKEVITYLSDPWIVVTDEDGLSDYDEAKTHFTDPTNYDTDGDGFTDYVEVIHGTDPFDPDNHLPIATTLPETIT
ncbi:MAG: hypothetical protein FK733_17510 [Asgard group archaeon]|nr:hypothetical protein [Asgard group archaeon]